MGLLFVVLGITALFSSVACAYYMGHIDAGLCVIRRGLTYNTLESVEAAVDLTAAIEADRRWPLVWRRLVYRFAGIRREVA